MTLCLDVEKLGVFLEDLSTNGTYLNNGNHEEANWQMLGKREKVKLAHGAQFRLAKQCVVSLLMQMTREADFAPLSPQVKEERVELRFSCRERQYSTTVSSGDSCESVRAACWELLRTEHETLRSASQLVLLSDEGVEVAMHASLRDSVVITGGEARLRLHITPLFSGGRMPMFLHERIMAASSGSTASVTDMEASAMELPPATVALVGEKRPRPQDEEEQRRLSPAKKKQKGLKSAKLNREKELSGGHSSVSKSELAPTKLSAERDDMQMEQPQALKEDETVLKASKKREPKEQKPKRTEQRSKRKDENSNHKDGVSKQKGDEQSKRKDERSKRKEEKMKRKGVELSPKLLKEKERKQTIFSIVRNFTKQALRERFREVDRAKLKEFLKDVSRVLYQTPGEIGPQFVSEAEDVVNRRLHESGLLDDK